MINQRTITDEQRDRILNIVESHFYDLKSKEIAPSKLSKTISAFANADGGDIYIGIKEIKDDNHNVISRIWNGFSSIEDANGHIQLCTDLYPPGACFLYEFLELEEEEGFVLHININKTNEIFKASDTIIYIRKSAQNIPLKNYAQIKQLEFDKGITSYEKQILNLPIDLITGSEVTKKFIENVVPTSTPIEWLKKQLLILNDRPTVAGILLFSDIPQAALPKQSAIKIYRYSSKEMEGKRDTLTFTPLTIEGCLYDQIHESVKITKEEVEKIRLLTDIGLINISYPVEALHEIITNAVLHRDYSIQKDIHIRIFDNRIEIESPGRLPGHITPLNILNEQFARNGSIVRFINKFPNPPNKDVGEGLNTAFESLKKLRLKPPVIEEIENSVIVIIKHELLASPEETVMKYINEHKFITNKIGRDITGIDSENSMKKVFKRLEAQNLIYLDPSVGGAHSQWLLVEKNQNDKINKDGQMNFFDLFTSN